MLPTTQPEDIGFDAVLLLSAKGTKSAPTIVTPHGGPHSGYVTGYSHANAYFNVLGYNVLQVNFRRVPSIPSCLGLSTFGQVTPASGQVTPTQPITPGICVQLVG